MWFCIKSNFVKGKSLHVCCIWSFLNQIPRAYIITDIFWKDSAASDKTTLHTNPEQQAVPIYIPDIWAGGILFHRHGCLAMGETTEDLSFVGPFKVAAFLLIYSCIQIELKSKNTQHVSSPNRRFKWQLRLHTCVVIPVARVHVCTCCSVSGENTVHFRREKQQPLLCQYLCISSGVSTDFAA